MVSAILFLETLLLPLTDESYALVSVATRACMGYLFPCCFLMSESLFITICMLEVLFERFLQIIPTCSKSMTGGKIL
jgi:hypothetical protein